MCEKIKILLYSGVVVFLIVSSIIYTYNLGYSAGSKSVEFKYQERLNQYQAEVKKKELIYAQENSALRNEVVLVQRNYESKLAVLDSTYNERLQESNSRAEYYRKQAVGATECGNLAAHTARLDQALTEGIALVKLLREHIELRDCQLQQVGEQLRQEREFLE